MTSSAPTGVRAVRLGACALALLPPLARPAFAQAPIEPTALPPVVVTGERMFPEAARIGEPVPEVQLRREDFTRLPADRASDIIPRLPGVVLSGPPGEKKNFGLRGLTPDFTRVQVDGLQLPSGAGARSLEPTTLPGFLLQSVGILRNPSAEYEADGIGGRILIETRPVPPRDALELRGALGGNDALIDGRNQQAGALVARRFSDGFGLLGAINVDRRRIWKIKDFSERTFQGGPGGQGQIVDERDPKDFTNIDALGQLGWVWDGGRLTLRQTLLHSLIDNPRRRDTYRRDTGVQLNRQLAEGEERLTVASLAVGLEQRLAERLTLALDAALSTAQLGKDGLTRTFSPAGAFQNASAEESSVRDWQWDLGASLAWRLDQPFATELKSGLKLRRVDRRNNAELFTVAANGSRSQTAADILRSTEADYTASETYLAGYIQNRIEFGRWTLIPGLRLEHVGYDLDGGRGSSTPGFTDVLPSLPVSFRLTEGLSLRAAVSRQVNRPKLEEIAPGTTRRGPRVFFGNPDLRPARAWSFDVGADYAGQHVFLGVNLFHRSITDVIDANEFAPNQFEYRNAGDGRVRGIEFEQRLSGGITGLDWLAPFGLRLNQTLLESRVNDPITGPRRFSEVPRFVANTVLEWNDEARGTLVSVGVNYVTTRIILSNEGNGALRYKELEPTTFVDVYLEQRLVPGLAVFASGENLTNQKRDEFERTNGVLSRQAIIDSGRVFFLGLKASL
ncbi:TonB-dependent receptor [Elioraea sp. Yellowstone]|jgi:outer membrane receptor for ferrienterochelin and colicins|uniref:TonB-dependent receptor plug domain-containing protein n=1 Tax=Elioraea sp. Yellowstone TaxID=2592070 RepID=UPI00115308E6|nr:TonB-dependent receptor [Elioraea sp. Yellowstone]TQF83775.1 TonB-dependent receptor [Elioraea sp. Yellowstone]